MASFSQSQLAPISPAAGMHFTALHNDCCEEAGDAGASYSHGEQGSLITHSGQNRQLLTIFGTMYPTCSWITTKSLHGRVTAGG